MEIPIIEVISKDNIKVQAIKVKIDNVSHVLVQMIHAHFQIMGIISGVNITKMHVIMIVIMIKDNSLISRIDESKTIEATLVRVIK